MRLNIKVLIRRDNYLALIYKVRYMMYEGIKLIEQKGLHMVYFPSNFNKKITLLLLPYCIASQQAPNKLFETKSAKSDCDGLVVTMNEPDQQLNRKMQYY